MSVRAETVRKCQVQDAELEDDLYGDLVPGSFPADTGLQDKIQEVNYCLLSRK